MQWTRVSIVKQNQKKKWRRSENRRTHCIYTIIYGCENLSHLTYNCGFDAFNLASIQANCKCWKGVKWHTIIHFYYEPTKLHAARHIRAFWIHKHWQLHINKLQNPLLFKQFQHGIFCRRKRIFNLFVALSYMYVAVCQSAPYSFSLSFSLTHSLTYFSHCEIDRMPLFRW